MDTTFSEYLELAQARYHAEKMRAYKTQQMQAEVEDQAKKDAFAPVIAAARALLPAPLAELVSAPLMFDRPGTGVSLPIVINGLYSIMFIDMDLLDSGEWVPDRHDCIHVMGSPYEGTFEGVSFGSERDFTLSDVDLALAEAWETGKRYSDLMWELEERKNNQELERRAPTWDQAAINEIRFLSASVDRFNDDHLALIQTEALVRIAAILEKGGSK